MEVARGISNMVVNAILPCLTFNKIVSNISWKDIKVVGVIILSSLMLFTLGGLCSVIAKWATPAPKSWFWGLLFAGIFPNISDLPIAYMQSMGGGTIFTEEQADKGVAYSFIFLFSQSSLMMNFGAWRLVGFDFKDNDTDNDCNTNTEEVEADNESDEMSNLGYLAKGSIKNNGQEDLEPPNNNYHPTSEGESSDAFELNSIDSYALSDEEISAKAGIVRSNVHIAPYHGISESTSYKEKGGLQKSTTMDIKLSKCSTAASVPAVIEELQKHTPIQAHLTRNLSLTNALERRLTKTNSRKQSVNSMIAEYSVVERLKSGDLNLHRPLTLTEDIGEENATLGAANDSVEVTHDEESLPNIAGANSNVSDENSRKKLTFARKLNIRISNSIRRYHLEGISNF